MHPPPPLQPSTVSRTPSDNITERFLDLRCGEGKEALCMLEKLYPQEADLLRHREGPQLKEREKYLAHLDEQGSKLKAVRDTAAMLLHVVQELDLKEPRDVQPSEVFEAGKRHARRRRPDLQLEEAKQASFGFRRVATNWLRFLGRLKVPLRPAMPFGELLADFAKWMSDERGFSSETVKTYCAQTGLFLRWFAEHHRLFSRVRLEDADNFLALKGRGGWNRISEATLARSLRAFFAHAERRGWCGVGIAKGILAPRLYRNADIPEGPSWDEILRLLRHTPNERAADIRARAILSLLAVYGLRSGELCRLLLTDLDWRREIFTVHHSKRGGDRQYPLKREVGNAILSYLTKARPRCTCRHVFVSMQIPYRPLTKQMVWDITKHRLETIGVVCRHYGPHALRHACATHLLRKGSSYKEIGDFLGHRSPNSPGIYAKTDLTMLRKVADFHFGGLQ